MNLKTVRKKLSDVHIKLYSSEDGSTLPFSTDYKDTFIVNREIIIKEKDRRMRHMFDVYTEGINVMAVQSIKIDKLSYVLDGKIGNNDVYVEITYDDDIKDIDFNFDFTNSIF